MKKNMDSGKKDTNASELKNSYFLDASESVEFFFFYCHRDLYSRNSYSNKLVNIIGLALVKYKK